MQNFARQTAIQVMYLSALADGLSSKGAPAGLATRAALTSLLDGTGLRYEFLNARSIRLLASPRTTDTAVRRRRGLAAIQLSSPALEEIIVSATKRDEPLHDVAISALVLPQLELDSAGIRGLGDIAAHTPGMQYDFGSQFGPGIMSNVVIRGISADRGTPPTVGIYIDDVPIQAIRISLYKTQPITFDLARVEVLRGPQGTLFGSSALGGAIRYVTNEASTTDYSQLYSGELSATAHGGIGAELGAIVDGPLQPGRLGGRVSAWYRKDGGYIDRINPLTGAVVDSNSNRSTSKVLRLGFVFEPDDSWRVVPAFHSQSIQLNDTPMLYATTPGVMSQAAPYNTALLQNGKLLRQPYDDQYYLGSIKVEKRLAAATLSSVTAWFERQASATVDQTNAACVSYFGDCGNPLGPAYPSSDDQAIPTYLGIRQSSFTQELRLSSSDASARLTWLAGLFYSHTHTHRVENTYQVILPQDPAIHSENFAANSSIDGFVNIGYAFTPRWRAGLGTRFGWSSAEVTAYESGYANTSGYSQLHNSGGYSAVPTAPRLELSYRPSERNFYYASVARGGRPGGNIVPAQCGSTPLPAHYQPDALWSYELGSKNLWFDKRLQLDASVYHVHWNGIQGHVFDACANSYTINAGLAISDGFDLSAEWNTERFNLRMALGHTDIRYRRNVYNTTGQLIAQRGAAVGGPPEVPAPWAGSLSLQYRWPLSFGVAVYVRGEELYASQNHGPFLENDPYAAYVVAGGAQADPATARLNLQLGVTRPALEFRLAIKNVLNSRPTLHATSDGGNSNLYYAYTFEPRSVALSVTRRF
jgi:outer membrane receptor protein involved in Fe transport